LEFVIGLDLGTTSCKAIAVTAEGRILAAASSSHAMQSPQPGWAQQQAEEVWQGASTALRSLTAHLALSQASALSVSGAMHSVVPIGREGAPVAAAMTWADNRAAQKARSLRQRTDPHALYLRTGCPLQAIYHPARLRWWLEESPQIAKRASYFVSIKDLVIHRLAGVWATDIGLASTTGLLDIHRFAWDEEALQLAGVTANRLPPLVQPQAIVGYITGDAARQTGLPAGMPVVAGSSDGGLANLGSGATSPGQVVITVGTSGAVRKVVDRPLLDPSERTWCYVLAEGRWYAGGAINNGGLAQQWVRQRFYPDLVEDAAAYEQLLADAESAPAGANGVFFLPYLSGERSPHWDPDARAMICGLSLESTRAHIARAALEGVAFCLADVWEVLVEPGESADVVRLTGAITASRIWPQILADVLGACLAPVAVADASALGACVLGYWALKPTASLEEVVPAVQLGQIIVPNPRLHAFYADRHKVFQSLYKRLVLVTKSNW
jgi:gluconokinase